MDKKCWNGIKQHGIKVLSVSHTETANVTMELKGYFSKLGETSPWNGWGAIFLERNAKNFKQVPLLKGAFRKKLHQNQRDI